MNIRGSKPRSGIALIMVLVVIVVLSVLAFGFAYSMKVEMTLARHAAFSSELDWAGRAGIEVAKWVLAEESKGQNAMADSLKCKWAGGPGETNSAVVDVDLNTYRVGEATLQIKITDLDRKVNINQSGPQIITHALTMIGVDAADITTVVDSILDWRDDDDQPHPAGAEKDFYESQPIPYQPKNGPIDDLSELLMIRGVTPAMYWGSGGSGRVAVMNRPSGARRSQLDEPTYAIGLADVFTPLSSRMLNVNTASPTVLQAIPEIDGNIAEAIRAARAGPDGQEGTEDDTPFRSPQELARVPAFVDPTIVQQISRYFTVRSLVFEVKVIAKIGSTQREYIAVLRRNSPKDIQTLNVYWR